MATTAATENIDLLRVNMHLMISKRLPGIFIPTLYFAEGLPYTLVMMVSGVFFKNLGADNIFIGLTSWLSLPWILKFAWAPAVDSYASKRTWIVWMQFTLAALVGILAFTTPLPQAVSIGVVLLFIIAIASATQDVAIDGYYLDILPKDQQAFYVGVRNAAYKVAWLFGSGGLVLLAGVLQEQYKIPVGGSWTAPFLVAAALLGVAGLFHRSYLPHKRAEAKEASENTGDQPSNATAEAVQTALTPTRFIDTFKTYFGQPGIGAVVFYIVTFRLGDALMLKQAPLFLMDAADKGGLAIPLSQIGIINGTVGMLFLLAGGIVGGILIAKQGLRKWFWPMSLLMNGALPLYWLLAAVKPGIAWVYVVNSIEQLAYGMGTAAYTVFLLTTIRNANYRAAHYAITTAMMALGVVIPQSISGYMVAGLGAKTFNELAASLAASNVVIAYPLSFYLQHGLGYANFFQFAFYLAIPGLLAIPFLPLWKEEEQVAEQHSKDAGAKAASR